MHAGLAMDQRPLIDALSAEIEKKDAEVKKARDDWLADKTNDARLEKVYNDLKEELDSLYEQRKMLLSGEQSQKVTVQVADNVRC